MASLFGTTYVYEKTFSKTKYMEAALWTKLTDEHLEAILLVGGKNSKANIDNSLKAKHKFYKLHKPILLLA